MTVVNISVAEHAAQTMKKAPRVAGDSRAHAARQSLMPAPRRTIRHRARAGGSRRPNRAASSMPRSRRAGVPGCLPAWGIGLPWNAAGTAGSVAATGSNLAFESASAPRIIGYAAGGPDREPDAIEEGEAQLVRSGYRVTAMEQDHQARRPMAVVDLGAGHDGRDVANDTSRRRRATPRSATPPSSSNWAPPPLGGLGRRRTIALSLRRFRSDPLIDLAAEQPCGCIKVKPDAAAALEFLFFALNHFEHRLVFGKRDAELL